MSTVSVIGAGAAGLMAAIAAAEHGHDVTVYEKNEKIGKKLYITGKGRCNLTNASDMNTVREHVISNPRFMYSAFDAWSNTDMMQLIEDTGCKLKVERGERVFPVSDHSSDVIRALDSICHDKGVKIRLYSEVKSLLISDGRCIGIVMKDGSRLTSDAVIVATGGISYQSTGSTGDGYKWAKEAGHSIVDTVPSLVPLVIKEDVCKKLQGLSLRNVEVSVTDGKKELYREMGEMLFTHVGVSGPLILSASSYVARMIKDRELILHIDMKPALSAEQLDNRILRDLDKYINKDLRNSLSELYPSKMIPVIIEMAELDPYKKAHELTKLERERLLEVTKDMKLTIVGTGEYREAIITKGGVSVKEIDPRTMESKKVPGLYFAGEVMDLDATTGGYNLQIAWSTGYCAGSSIY